MSKSWLFKGKDKATRPTDVASTSASQSGTSTPTSSSGRERIRDTAIPILDLGAAISESSDVLAPMKAACMATRKVLEISRAMESNKEGWNTLAERLKDHLKSMQEQITIFEGYPEERLKAYDSLREPLLAYVRKLDKIQQDVEKRTRSRFLSRATKVDSDADDIKRFNDAIDHCHQNLTAALAVSSSVHIQAVKADTEDIKEDAREIKDNTKTLLTEADRMTIRQLQIVSPKSPTLHDQCKAGTRVAVLETIRRWGEGEFPEPIFWLCDIAGSGKSTVSTTMVAKWKEAHLLGGHFFFSMANSEESTIDKICPTFATQISENIPTLIPAVADAVRRHPAIMTNTFKEQFQKLVVEPTKHHDKTVIIVIDALDECEPKRERDLLLGAVSAAAQTSPNLKFFLTSRPESDIEKALGTQVLKRKLAFRLHDPDYPDNVDDVAAYIREMLKDEEGLSPEQILNLIKKANGLFIWAKTVCEMFDSDKRIEPAEVIYERITSGNNPSDIDTIYELILDRLEPNVRQASDRLLPLLVAAFEPLAPTSLDIIIKEFGLKLETKTVVKRLGNVLHVDQTTGLIRFRHPTFVEYLKRRSHPEGYLSGPQVHATLGEWSLKTMKDKLKFNICKLGSSSLRNRDVGDFEDRVTKLVPPELRYASSHWLSHLSETDDASRQKLLVQVRHAIRAPQVLYWFEILSVTLGVSRAIANLRGAASHFEDDIYDRMVDIRRFLMAYSTPIQESLPHIYLSALPFTPINSILRKESLKWFPKTLSVVHGLDEAYPRLTHEIRGHEKKISAIVFSPDGLRVISSAEDSTVRIWDLETGQMLGEPLRGHTEGVNCVAVSPDGSCIASGSKDRSIRLWDPENNSAIGDPMRGHSSWVSSLSFSPDGLHIVSGGHDWNIRLWDVKGRVPVGEPLRGHEGVVTSLAFFPDGSRVVSGSEDKTVQLWDMQTLQPIGEPLRDHDARVTSVLVSKDGSQILSASADVKIRFWDSKTGELLRKWSPMGYAAGRNVVFSSDGSRAVTIGESGIVMWETESGIMVKAQQTSIGDSIHTVALSRDDRYVVSGSHKGVIRLWDGRNFLPLGKKSQGRGDAIFSVAVSRNGSMIASCSTDATIRLWDTKTGKERGRPLRHDGVVLSVAFSADDSLIASGGRDRVVRVWEVDTHKKYGEPLQGHEAIILSLCLSHSSYTIASGSEDGNIFVWDEAEAPGRHFHGHLDSVLCVAFSLDDLQLVSGSRDGMIHLWDVSTGEILKKITHIGLISAISVAMSLDGSYIAASSESPSTVLVLNTTTEEESIVQLPGRNPKVCSVALSYDGSQLISGLEDGTIQMRDIPSDQALGALRGHTSEVTKVLPARDGSCIASYSNDYTIRVWNTLTLDTDAATTSAQSIQLSSHSAASHKFSSDELERIALSDDGWITLDAKLLFWVPPNHRHGLKHPCMLTITSTSHLRMTKFDFRNFVCGTSWANVQRDAPN